MIVDFRRNKSNLNNFIAEKPVETEKVDNIQIVASDVPASLIFDQYHQEKEKLTVSFSPAQLAQTAASTQWAIRDEDSDTDTSYIEDEESEEETYEHGQGDVNCLIFFSPYLYDKPGKFCEDLKDVNLLNFDDPDVEDEECAEDEPERGQNEGKCLEFDPKITENTGNMINLDFDSEKVSKDSQVDVHSLDLIPKRTENIGTIINIDNENLPIPPIQPTDNGKGKTSSTFNNLVNDQIYADFFADLLKK
ncbi:unnamed protein product [Bursaphelenchus okinawaensis]|uniref:Uncharacterized protein n=1 Tax=Bursaphelenchus okinawaensis TaxID=465554 RepID=A0A811KHX6_9BILA|nr:unnamed protein product [Bursaphelenchus okinawaensis]CAG9103564.1 unnamed protein product [Bursaphelenchus okinawaensis]